MSVRTTAPPTLPERFFHELPKVELHCHLLGTVQRATLTAGAGAGADAATRPAATALRDHCAERGIVFTVVPTNSYYLRTLPQDRWALDHPIRFMPGMGIAVHPNTDDPTLHLVTPTEAWQQMLTDFGFDAQALRGFMHHGIQAAWVDEANKARWRGQFSAEFDALLAPNA